MYGTFRVKKRKAFFLYCYEFRNTDFADSHLICINLRKSVFLY